MAEGMAQRAGSQRSELQSLGGQREKDRKLGSREAHGLENGAESRLLSHIMDALLKALHRQGQNRSTYLASLDQKMVAI